MAENNDDSWFADKFSKLNICDGHTLTGLSEIHTKLQSLNSKEIAQVFRDNNHQVQLSTVFACVEKVSSQQTHVACEILSICLATMDLGSKGATSTGLLDEMIHHDNEDVKLIGLTQLERLMRKDPEVKQSSSVVVDLIKCIDHPSTSIGTTTMRLVIDQLPMHFDDRDVREAFEQAGHSSSTAKCRVYEVAVSISSVSAQYLKRMEDILERILADLSGNDVLLQLNIMEVLSQLVTTEWGLKYLEEHGLFPRLLVALENLDLMHILFPGFIKFFGSVANSHPDKIFTKFSHICKPLFETIISNDSDTLGACLDTLGILGRSREGKIGLSGLSLVCSQGDMMMVLMEMTMFLNTLSTEEQIRILNCLEMLFHHESETEPDNRICLITEAWYQHLDRDEGPGLKVIFGYCRNPFSDIKLAGLGVLRAIVDYPWGRSRLANTAGLLESLLDRGLDTNTEAFQAKFEILKRVDKSPESFSETQRSEIRDYVSKGPFYRKGITEVTMEGQ